MVETPPRAGPSPPHGPARFFVRSWGRVFPPPPPLPVPSFWGSAPDPAKGLRPPDPAKGLRPLDPRIGLAASSSNSPATAGRCPQTGWLMRAWAAWLGNFSPGRGKTASPAF
ncbi:hypothetical protein GCM10023080_060160 [Streptomyces pseudoechinosporeus]